MAYRKLPAPEYFEGGVHYFRIDHPSLEFHPFPATEMTYSVLYKPTGRTSVGTVFVESPEDLQRLCDWWSRGEWEYEPIGVVQ